MDAVFHLEYAPGNDLVFRVSAGKNFSGKRKEKSLSRNGGISEGEGQSRKCGRDLLHNSRMRGSNSEKGEDRSSFL